MKSPFIDKATAELIGKIAVLEQIVAELIKRLDERERKDREFEQRLSRVVSPSQLVTEAQEAELLDVSVQTLARWRKSSRPPIPFIAREGLIRYRAEDVEKFVREGTRGAKKGA